MVLERYKGRGPPILPVDIRPTQQTDWNPSTGQNGRNGPETEVSQENLVRGRSRTDGSTAGNTSGGTLRMCTMCGEPLIGKYVRALKGTFHLECFMCRVG